MTGTSGVCLLTSFPCYRGMTDTGRLGFALQLKFRQVQGHYRPGKAQSGECPFRHARARASGKRFGRPSALNDEQKKSVLERLSTGMSVSAVAREFGTTRQTILRVKAAVLAA